MTSELHECCGGVCGDPQPGLCFDPKGAELVPTQWAYEQACKALWKHRSEVERLRAENEELQAKVAFIADEATRMTDHWRDAMIIAINNKAELDKHKSVVRFWRDIFGRSR